MILIHKGDKCVLYSRSITWIHQTLTDPFDVMNRNCRNIADMRLYLIKEIIENHYQFDESMRPAIKEEVAYHLDKIWEDQEKRKKISKNLLRKMRL